MKFSVCFLTYKRDDDIVSCLNSLFGQVGDMPGEAEFIVVDNNPECCRVKDIAVPTGVSFHYIHTGHNLGVAGGRNAAANAARGEYIIFFDDDVIVPDFKRICTEVSDAFERDRRLGAVAMRVVDHYANEIREFEVPHPNKSIDMTSSFYTSHCIGAGHAVRRGVFEEVHGFDANLGLYGMEEIEFCYRLIGQGYSIQYLPGCEVRHLRSPAGRMQSGDVLYRNFVNKCNIAKRYLPFPYVLSHLLVWGGVYLMRSGDFAGMVRGYRKIFSALPGRGAKFGKEALDYMRDVRARLVY